MELQSKKQSFWSTFKKAYLKSRNLKKIWNKLDKSNLPSELVETFNLYLNSESYSWSAKHWRNNIINHLHLITNKKNENPNWIISKEYFYFDHFDDSIIDGLCREVKDKKINLDINLYKKHNNLSLTESLHYNLVLLLLYEAVKSRDVFNYLEKLVELELNSEIKKPSLVINDKKIVQDDLNSLLEFEQIEKLLKNIQKRKNIILEIGAGSGRTAKTVISILGNVKYVIADIPPAINLCINNLKKYFPNKNFATAFKLENQKDLNIALENNDILFIFPHQIKLFANKTFDIVLAIDCLHEMEKKIIEIYMSIFEQISTLLYFKVWEYSGLNYSFYERHSVHRKSDYSIKNNWKELLNQRCLYPSKYFELGYELIEKENKTIIN